MAGKTKNASVNHLRAWREFRELTQMKLAELANTKPSVISEMESGKQQLSEKWLRTLAPILGTSPGFLLDHDPNDLDSDWTRATEEFPRERRAEAMAILRVLSSRP